MLGVADCPRRYASQIIFIDERWSSKAAKRSIIDQGIKTGHNKSLIDKTAAALFLQQYLDQKK